jgi:hypothetical protein
MYVFVVLLALMCILIHVCATRHSRPLYTTAVEEHLKNDSQSPQRLRCLRTARNKLVAARATFDETDWYKKENVNSFLKWLVHENNVDKQSVQYCEAVAGAKDHTLKWQEMFCAEAMETIVNDILQVKYGALSLLYCL